ncbi:late histone H2A.L3-like [Ranitomeya imitator]|uniref:late histone H2A.L3-like n=1 Tax=Ranitomeya imitator TaxID=111125 RepID=UPI0037E8AB23
MSLEYRRKPENPEDTQRNTERTYKILADVVLVLLIMFGRGNKVQKPAAGKTSRSAKAGLQFPVGHIHRFLRKGNYAAKIRSGADIYLPAILEYLCAEVLKLSGNAAKDDKKSRILLPHIQLVFRNDEELSKLFDGVTIAEGGILPNIHAVLVPTKTARGSSSQEPEASESQEF